MDLITIRFHGYANLVLAFYGVENEHGVLESIGLAPRTDKIKRLPPELLTRAFVPQLMEHGANRWILKIRPLEQDIYVEKRPTGKYVCFYVFEKKLAHIQEVVVDGTILPKKMWFTIHATFQPAKDAPKQHFKTRIDCADSFTNTLSDILQS